MAKRRRKKQSKQTPRTPQTAPDAGQAKRPAFPTPIAVVTILGLLIAAGLWASGWSPWPIGPAAGDRDTTATAPAAAGSSTDGTASTPPPPSAAHAPRPNQSPPQKLSTVPGLEKNRFDAIVRDVAEREDPVLDGWDTERFNEVAGKQLKAIGKLLTHPEILDSEHATPLIHGDFQSIRGIRPAKLQPVFRERATVIKRSAADASKAGTPANSADQRGISAFLAAMRRQAEPLAETDDQRFKFKIIRVHMPPPAQPKGTDSDSGETDAPRDQATTVAYFQVNGRNGQRAVQANSTWTCVWQLQPTGTPKLLSVEVEDYEEIVYTGANGPMFADCTESIFVGSDRFQRQLIHGIDYWTEQFDGAIARPAAGHGIAIGDVNGDGLDDMYLCQSPALPNLLLIQNSDGTVRDIAPEAGVNWLEGTRAALLCDLDNDGDQDLTVVLGGKVVVHANDGTGHFQRMTIVDAPSSLFALNAVDYDNDGDLDIFICGYTFNSGVNINDVFANPMPFHDANNGAPNVLLRNEGDWKFLDVTKEVGLDQNSQRFSYASTWDDYDNDGDMDVYVANDFGRNNLYRNDGGKFVDVAPKLDVEDIGPGMSAAWGDYNNDGRPDLYVSNMFSSAGNRITTQLQFKTELDQGEKQLFQRHARGNSLFESTEDGGFRDRSVELGITLGRWAWGSLFVDINNDGWEDIYVANGFITADNNNDL